jgi:molybdopterin-guanine dinucleotide biosynthesis protein A
MGSPKAWLPFGPERLLQRIVRLVGTAVSATVVVAAPGQEIPELPGDIRVIRDPIAGRGPLQGLAAGLAASPESIDLVYATATDVPFLEPRWITRLTELIGDRDLAIPYIGQEYHPLAALYRKAVVLPSVGRMLSENRRRVKDIVNLVRTRVVNEEDLRSVDPQLATLRNLNDRQEYQQALRDAGLSGP